MTNEEAIKAIKANYPSGGYEDLCVALEMAIKALEHTWRGKAVKMLYCDDAVSREALKKMLIGLDKWHIKNKQFVNVGLLYDDVFFGIEQLPSVTQKPGKCKTCKYWQDNNNGYPSDMCKWRTDETPDADDYCSEYEPQESEDKE